MYYLYKIQKMNKSFVVARHKDGSSITVYLQGAHLTSWRNNNGEELLYTSPEALYTKGVAIRGGVPIIFPQFGNMGPLPAHGFARVREWTQKEVDCGTASFTLDVASSELRGREAAAAGETVTASSAGTVSLLYTITFSNEHLHLQIEIANKVTDAKAVKFAFAFHTYFAVEDISRTRVKGLDMTPYIDNLDKGRGVCPPKEYSSFTGEVDRIYVNQSNPVLLLDMAKQRMMRISGNNLSDVVLWNPWVEKTRRLKDLPADGYTKFVCVEHGAIAEEVTLPPHSVWRAGQCITLLPISKA